MGCKSCEEKAQLRAQAAKQRNERLMEDRALRISRINSYSRSNTEISSRFSDIVSLDYNNDQKHNDQEECDCVK
jgi:hypothetical protein